MAQGYLIFHLNLAFSSIPAEARPDVIRKCYWPLLDLAEDTGIPIGIELTGWTLQQIASLDQSWVQRFRQMLDAKQCELIGSGWSQIIGPLVPYDVNRWNQKLGLEAYWQILGVTPRIALVNEMAFSTGLVNMYVGAGYEGIVMDRDNVRLALGLDHAPISATPTHAMGCGDVSLPVLWADSILFQRLQRVVHGDIPVSEYMAYVKQRADQDGAVLPIYCNDAEIFDYRPGRFTTESRLHPEGEWERLKRVCKRLQENLALGWLSPSEALERQVSSPNQNVKRLTSVSQPIPVKKQAKYNIHRWAVTGRDNLWLNTSCHEIHRALVQNGDEHDGNWRELCEFWGSDFRTHITEARWSDAVARISDLMRRLGLEQLQRNVGETEGTHRPLSEITLPEGVQIVQDEEGILWTIKTPYLHLVLNARRGLTIKSLAFKSHDYESVVGTLPQGYFSSIELGADFYSGGVIIEMPGEHARVTDLERVVPKVFSKSGQLLLQAQIQTRYGTIVKTVTVERDGERVSLGYRFPGWKKMRSIVRAGIVTLLPEAFDGQVTLECANGGPDTERFVLDRSVDHSAASSSLVSSTTGFGATTGEIVVGDGKRRVSMTWDPWQCAAVPMLVHRQAEPHALTRLVFSICEVDDTSRPEGVMPEFTLNLAAA